MLESGQEYTPFTIMEFSGDLMVSGICCVLYTIYLHRTNMYDVTNDVSIISLHLCYWISG